MSCNPVFLTCKKCNMVLELICNERTEKYECCNEELKELVPNTSEGAAEKHLPVVEVNGNKITVKVGSVLHPMSEEHSIDWVYLQTKKGGQRVHLNAAGEPAAEFIVTEDDQPIAAYAFCNLHGFWKTDVK